MLSRRGALTSAAACAAVGAWRLTAPAAAQTYPAGGPIRVIVPFAPAGPVDILARIIVEALAKQLGQSVKGHFAVELLKLRAGIDLVHVPYASGAQVAQSLMTDTTQVGSTALPAGATSAVNISATKPG